MADLKGDAQAKDGQGNPSNPKGDAPISSDLFGNKNGGKGWADGEYLGIKKITAIVEDGIFTGFQLDYIGDDGSVVHGDAHGSTQLQYAKYFNLNYPSEVLTNITGYYGEHDHIEKIKSLIFTTNTGKTFAVGVAPSDTKFAIPPASKIIGLFGRADAHYVYAMGGYYYK